MLCQQPTLLDSRELIQLAKKHYKHKTTIVRIERERSKIEKNVKSDEPVSSIHQEGKHVLFYKHTHAYTYVKGSKYM